MDTGTGSVAPFETPTVPPRRRRIPAVILAAVFGIGISVGRASAPSDGRSSGRQTESTRLVMGDLRDPMAELHSRIYARFPER